MNFHGAYKVVVVVDTGGWEIPELKYIIYGYHGYLDMSSSVHTQPYAHW